MPIRIVLVALSVFALVACKAGEKSSQPRSSEPAPEAAERNVEQAVGQVLEKVADPSVRGCLEKVKAGSYAEALPLCLKGASVEPDNADVRAALAEARRKAATAVAAEQAAGAREAIGQGAARAKSAAEQAAQQGAGSPALPEPGQVPQVPKMPSVPKLR